MKTLFQIQTESGQLWLDIKSHLDAKDAEIAKASAAAPRLAKLLDAAQKALAAGDMDSLKAILTPVVEEEKLSEKQRRLAELDRRQAELDAERAKINAEPAAKK